MNVPKSFVDLVYSNTTENYIGMGNPNARVLIIGREPAHDVTNLNTEILKKAEKYQERDQTLNKTNWKNLLETKPLQGVEIDSRLQICDPRRPFPNQKCLRRVTKNDNGEEIDNGGTSQTWVNYQKLVDLILGREYERAYMLRPVDFHDFCFHTDISSASAKSLATTNKEAKKISVEKRSNELFGKDLFKQFPIIILAVGTDIGENKYVRPDWCEKVLGFPREEVEEKIFTDDYGKKLGWVQVNRDKKNHRILLHTYCLSQVANEYLEKIRDLLWEEGFGNSYYCWPSAY